MPVTVFAYILFVIAIYLAFPAMLQGLFFLLLCALGANKEASTLSLAVASAISWAIMAALWQLIEGNTIPMLVLGIAFIWLFVHGWIAKGELTEASTKNMAAEAWGIIIVAVYQLTFSDPVRWV